jgi:hypothetical protein
MTKISNQYSLTNILTADLTNSRIGVNNTNPSYSLDLTGDARVGGSLIVTGNLTAQQFIVSSSVTYLTESFASGSHKFGDSSDDNHNFTGSLIVSGSANPLNVGSNLLFVSSSGNIGIGVSTPSTKLHVYEALTNSTSYLTIQNNRARNAAVFTQTTNGGFYAGTSIGTDTFNYQIYDGVAGSARLTISSTGAATFSSTVTAQSGFKLPANGNGTSPTLAYNNSLGFGVNGTGIFFGNLYNSDLTTAMQLRVTNAGGTDVTAMTLLSSGNVGIGTTTIANAISGTETVLKISNSNAASLYLESTGGNKSYAYYIGANGALSWYDITAGLQRMSIATDGKLTITAPNHMQLRVKSSTSGDASFEFGAEDNVIIGFQMATTANGITWFTGRHRPGASGITDEMNIYRNSTNLFRLQSNGNYSFAGSNVSDIRLKENIEVINYNATEKLLQLSPVSYNMIEHPIIHKSGFIAQEVREILPNFVTGNESEDEYLGIDYNGILSLAVKAIQELSATNESLKNRIEVLENK